MDSINKLTKIFGDFPGIGPRQSKRFVYFLLSQSPSFLKELSESVADLKSKIKICDSCFRFFTKNNQTTGTCNICSDKSRDKSSLMIVARDVDFESMEKTKFFNGYYFVLGGTVPILEKEPEKKIKIRELIKTIENRSKEGLKEIVLALNLNPEGENTERYLKSVLSPTLEKFGIKVSTLGRGLSTGTELEYSDSETIKNALKNRQ